MKYKQKVDFFFDLFLLLFGIALLIFGIFNIGTVKLLFVSIMMMYALLNIIQYFLTRQNKDYEGFYTFIASLCIAITTILFYKESGIAISLILLGWTTLMAIIKYIKTDYYNDRHDRMWKVKMFTLIIFIVMGVLSSLAILSVGNKIIILGYYFFINGVLELIDPIIKYLIGK